MFLPEIEKANKELESAIQSQGAASVVIDTTLFESTVVGDHEDMQEDEIKDFLEVPEEDSPAVPVVNIDFALGDFDGTPIAIAEDAKNEDDETRG
jgi:hypothetical protein